MLLGKNFEFSLYVITSSFVFTALFTNEMLLGAAVFTFKRVNSTMRLSIVAPNKVEPEPALPPVMPAPQLAGAHAEPSVIFASQRDDQMD
jgi:hypothetical protein